MVAKLSGFRVTGRHGNRPGSAGAGAENVLGGIADDKGLGWTERPAGMLFGPLERDGPQFVSIVMIVAESAKLEKPIELVVRDLGPGALRGIAGEKSENVVGVVTQMEEQFADSGHQTPANTVVIRQFLLQLRVVGVVEATLVRRRQIDLEKSEQAANDSGVGASGNSGPS